MGLTRESGEGRRKVRIRLGVWGMLRFPSMGNGMNLVSRFTRTLKLATGKGRRIVDYVVGADRNVIGGRVKSCKTVQSAHLQLCSETI